MDKYDYVIAKPEMEEVLYHAGFHKYIDKYLGKNGKWIYKYAGQAKNAVSGAVNKAKTMLPGLQKQATGAVSTAKKQASSMMSTGRKTASTAKKQARNKINKMLPILSKKLSRISSKTNRIKRKAVDTRNEIRNTGDDVARSARKTAKKLATSNAYQRTKRKVGESVGKYTRSTSKRSATKGDSRYRNTGNLRSRGYSVSTSSQVGLGKEEYNNEGKYFYNTQPNYVKTTTYKAKANKFVTKRRNSKAAATARKNRRAK